MNFINSGTKTSLMDAKQLDSYKRHNNLLSQFIVRLSAFYEGFSDDIDTELKVLRGHLSGSPNFTLAAVSINKLNRIIQHQDIMLNKYTTDTSAKLEHAIKSLQKIVFEDEPLKQQATQQLIALNQPNGDIFSLYRLFQQAIDLHQQALSARQQTQATNQEVSQQANKIANPLYQSILTELNQLIESYAQKKPDDPQLIDIKSRLNEGMDEDGLLKSCVVVLRMIVQDAMSEANLTGKVIQSLHTSLDKVGTDIQLCVDGSRSQFEQRQVNSAAIQSHIENIEEAVNQSESIESLKEYTQFSVQHIATALNQQIKNDSEGQAQLMELLSSMQSQIAQLQQQTRSYKKKLAEQVKQNQTDPLTRLPNRQAYNEKLNQAYQHWCETGDNLSVAIVDIDNFKRINDKFGHAAGDKTLQVVGRHLRRYLSAGEFIARWGGEEFVLLLPSISNQQLGERLETIRSALAQLPFKFKQEKVSITASFGATQFRKGDTQDTVFERADSFLYKAKREGRNQVVTD